MENKRTKIKQLAESIFNETARGKMKIWDLNKFKKDFPTLFKVIIESAVQLSEASLCSNCDCRIRKEIDDASDAIGLPR